MPYRSWARLTLFNFFLVALAGAVMRYKIAYSLPWVDQKHLLHGHSHFAFSGWVSAALFLSISQILYPIGAPRVHNWLFLVLMAASYGMLFTFPVMGYDGPSIFFSAVTVLVGYAYALLMWKPLGRLGEPGKWFRIALASNAVSSLGTYALAWLMQQPGISQKWYVGSVYFFLHFQYNGWFFFAIAGLFIHYLFSAGYNNAVIWRKARLWLVSSLVPAVFLSALWLELPWYLYATACLAAFMQLPGLVYFLKGIPYRTLVLVKGTGLLWGTALLSLVFKLFLQLLSCVPALSHFAFGYRPLVIAYLHLVLLAMISMFILGYFLRQGWLRYSWAVLVVWVTVLLNELILIFQGLGAIGYMAVPHVNTLLFLNAVVLLVSILILPLDRKRDPMLQ